MITKVSNTIKALCLTLALAIAPAVLAEVIHPVLPLEYTGLWGVDGTDTTGWALDVSNTSFAAILFGESLFGEQAWLIANGGSIIEQGKIALYRPVNGILGPQVGWSEFSVLGPNSVLYAWSIVDSDTRLLFCDSWEPYPITGGICSGTDVLVRITQPVAD